jgi:hypothetical protein
VVGIKTVAALVSIANGIWGVVIGVYWHTVLPQNPFPGVSTVSHLPQEIFLALGIVLILDSLVCLVGWPRAFYVSAGISLLVLLLEWAFNLDGSTAFLGGVALAAVTIGLDVVAARAKKVMSEADHPMNLPVFG